jgi:hypothetical protein
MSDRNSGAKTQAMLRALPMTATEACLFVGSSQVHVLRKRGYLRAYIDINPAYGTASGAGIKPMCLWVELDDVSYTKPKRGYVDPRRQRMLHKCAQRLRDAGWTVIEPKSDRSAAKAAAK